MLAGNIGYHFQLLSSVIEVNELQKRRVTSKLTQAPRLAGGQADRDPRPRLQARHRRHARGLEPRAGRAAAGRGRVGRRLRPGRRDRAGELLPDVEMAESALDALDGADAAVLVTEWPQFGELDWAEVASRMAKPLIVDGRNFLDAEAVRAAGLDLRGDRPPSEVRREARKGVKDADAGPDPGRRRRHAPAPADQLGGEAGAAPGRPAPHRLRDRLAHRPWRRRRRDLLRPPGRGRALGAAGDRGRRGRATPRSPTRAAPPGRSASPRSTSPTASSSSTATSSATST